MQAVQELAEAILRGLPPDLPDDIRTARALFLAGVAALFEAGLSRTDVVQMAEGDWDAVDEALQASSACGGCLCGGCDPGDGDAELSFLEFPFCDDTLIRH